MKNLSYPCSCCETIDDPITAVNVRTGKNAKAHMQQRDPNPQTQWSFSPIPSALNRVLTGELHTGLEVNMLK